MTHNGEIPSYRVASPWLAMTAEYFGELLGTILLCAVLALLESGFERLSLALMRADLDPIFEIGLRAISSTILVASVALFLVKVLAGTARYVSKLSGGGE